jgi:DNA helicase HerA-like ATPase
MLKLADNLKLPVDAVTQTFAIFGKRGAGKSNTATVMAEEMFPVAPFVVLTPLDNWWGLKASFDGKGDGLKVYVFGGDHGDLPLDQEGVVENARPGRLSFPWACCCHTNPVRGEVDAEPTNP